jgi:hypothetical protein
MTMALKRIYFDTNILRHWPHPPNDIYSIFRAAKWLGTELFMPEVVEGELRAQFVRSVNAAYDAANQNLKEITKLCRDIIAVDIQGTRPSDDELYEAFNKRSDQMKAHFGISVIPLPQLDIGMLVDMAITRTAPFEERTVGADKIVTGLQDAAILFSVLDHMKTAPESDRCAIISNDKIFHAAKTRKLVQLTGTRLEAFKTISALFDDLYNHIWDATRAGWRAEMAQIEVGLNADKEELSRQIQAILPTSEVGRQIWGRVKEVTGFSVTEFRYILTELPESRHRPPHTETYKRPDGDEVKISAKAFTKIDAIVETTNWLSVLAIGVQQPPITTKTETATLTEILNVSITGTVRDGIVGDFKVTSIDPERR